MEGIVLFGTNNYFSILCSDGEKRLCAIKGKRIKDKTGVYNALAAGDEVVVQAGEQGIRFLLVSGRPIEEPVAWYGPIVMNTKAELQTAISELRNDTFIRHA